MSDIHTNKSVAMLQNVHFKSLRQIPVAISGEWQSGEIRDWIGTARAKESIAAISFLSDGNTIDWCKSSRPEPAGQVIRLWLGRYDAIGLDIQTSFSVGVEDGNVRSRTTVESIDYKPLIETPVESNTAALLHFSDIAGTTTVQLFALFLAGSDVKVGRNGLWHLRAELVPSVPSIYREILSYGRKGSFSAN